MVGLLRQEGRNAWHCAEGRRKKETVAVGQAWDFEKKEGKKENGLMGPVRKKRKIKRKKERKRGKRKEIKLEKIN